MRALAAVLLVVPILLAVFPSASSLPQPKVSLPPNWTLKGEVPYPNAAGVHDPQGSGLLTYEANDSLAMVDIYYESSLNRTYSAESLLNESVWLMTTSWKLSVNYSSVMTVAGVSAGYASHRYKLGGALDLVVFVKGNYYFDIDMSYAVGSPHEAELWSILNSINFGTTITTTSAGGTTSTTGATTPPAQGAALPAQAAMIVTIGGEIAIVIALGVLIIKTLRTEF
jgi:hypothetical protein